MVYAVRPVRLKLLESRGVVGLLVHFYHDGECESICVSSITDCHNGFSPGLV